jgi:hypothetical protein
MHLVNLEPALADEFRAIAENDGATRFWHAHCSKNKIHKKIKQRWLWLFDGDEEAAASFHRLREDYLDLVGMSAHPTFPASFVTFMDSPSGIESDSIVRNALGQVSHMSKFSIHLLLLRIFEYGFLWSGPEISLYKNDEGAVESSLSENISKGLSVLLSIVKSAESSEDGQHPFFPEFKTYWRQQRQA